MTELVYLKNDEAVCSSLQVAEKFGKRHDRVLRAIDNLLETLPKNGEVSKMFILSKRKAADGQFHRMYFMNRDGFSLLVMGFTGKKALEWKLKYIKAFNQMEKFILERQTQAWIDSRKAGKLTRKAETDTIKKLVEYAQAQGSQHADKLYMTYSKLANKMAGVSKRDEATVAQLNNLSLMNDNLQGALALFKSAAERLGIELYESIQTPLKDIVKVGADSLSQLTKAFQSEGTAGLIEAGGQIIANLLTGIAGATPKVLDISIRVIQAIVQNLVDNMPQIATAGGQILTTLGQGISDLIPILGVLAYTILTTFLTGIIDHGPEALTAGTQMLTSVLDGISSKLPDLIPLAVSAILSFAQGLVDNLPAIVQAGLNMLVALAEGIANSLPTLIEQVPKLINTFCENIDSLLPKILAAGIKILLTLAKGIIQSIPTIIANAGEIVKAILNVITHLNLFTAGKGIIQGLGNGLKSMLSSIASIARSIINAIKNPFSINWGSIGENIARGIANGLRGAAGAIARAAMNAAKAALNAAKSFLGIHSPSTVFRDQVGKYMALGMGEGFEDNIPTKEMGESIDKAVRKVELSVSGGKSERVDVQKATGKKDDGDDSGTPIVINNTFEVDGKPLVTKTTKAVIKKIDGDKKDYEKSKGVKK